jgi:hypothetical protein
LRQLGLQDLDRDAPLVLPVDGQIHDRRPAAAKLTLELVAVAERRLETAE